MSYLPVISKRDQFFETSFCVDGLKCASCAQACKRIIYKLFQDAYSEVDMNNKSVHIRFRNNPKIIDNLVEKLKEHGFLVKPFHNKNFRQELIQVAVAGFCSGNVMLMAFAEYFNKIDPPFDLFFHVTSLFLTTLALVFAGRSLIDNAFASIKNKKIDIDFGILLGFGSAYLFSAYNVLRGSGELYFDSITVVIFLILVGRFIKNRKLEIANQQIEDSFVNDTDYCTRVVDGKNETIEVYKVKTGDTLLLKTGEILPLSGTISYGSGSVDLSSVNGEPNGIKVHQGDHLPAGAIALDSYFKIESLSDGGQSSLKKAEKISDTLLLERSQWQSKADKIASFYVIALLASIAILLTFNIGGSLEESLRRSVALLLVACPCALGFAFPLALGRAISLLSAQGVVVQRLEALENTPNIATIWFDKTGTLTTSKTHIAHAHLHSKKDDVYSILSSAVCLSNHHICQALEAWIKQENVQDSTECQAENFKEIVGEGLEFQFLDRKIRLGRKQFACNSQCNHLGEVHLNQNGICIASFQVQEELQTNVKESLLQLKDTGYNCGILSGDQSQRTKKLGSMLGLDGDQCSGELTPKEKLAKVQSMQKNSHKQLPMVVGNGFNDMLALAGSQVSAAVKGSQPAARKRADYYFTKDGLTPLISTISTAQALKQTIKRIITFSLFYNASALFAASLGYITPLIAAILMPISSFITITLSTFWSVQTLRKRM